MHNFFKNKNILVADGTGMIGRSLVNLLSEMKCNITVVSIDKVNSNNEN
jgi:nucleoside-diphosphate-sugar epimerase